MTNASPDASRPVRRRSNTRAQLVAAAEAVFDETGTTAVSVEAIVGRAGFTRGAFYSNFQSVDELFFAAYEQQSITVFELLSDVLGSVRGTETPSLDDVVQGVVGGLPPEEKWYAIRSVLITRARHDQALNQLLREHTDRFHDTLQPLLIDSLNRVGLRPVVDPALFTRAVVASHVGAVSQSILHDNTEQVRVTAVEGCILGLTESISK